MLEAIKYFQCAPAHTFQARRMKMWHSYNTITISYFSLSPWSLLPKTNLDRAAVVCVEGGVEMSHQQLQGLSLSFAGRLTRDLGYGVGDKLALVLGGNYVESIIVQAYSNVPS